MPPRGLVIAIVVFWFGTSCLWIQREIVPRWQAGSAPAFSIELSDEVGTPQVEWQVFQNNKKIGRGISHIRRQPDRTFEMSQQFRFDDFEILVLNIKRLDTVYRVTREGQLLAVHVAGSASIKDAGGPEFTVNAELSGDVIDGYLEPKLKAFGQPVEFGGLGKIHVAEHGSILNPMHLLHRLPRLQEGQRWQVPLFDPLKMFSAKEILGQKLPALGSSTPFLDAEVFADTLTWNREEVPCFRVSYSEPGKKEIARTWVRRDDGAVLAQESHQHGYEFSIRREP